MTRLLAIDPGSVQSGFVLYDTGMVPLGRVIVHGTVDNEVLLAMCWRQRDPAEEHHLAIELINVFGKANADVFRTCIWHGRFVEAWGATGYTEITRHAVKMHLCHTAKSGDSDVRAALIARWGGEATAIGGKGRGKDKTPTGPLHGIASHAWQALAVAVTWSDMHAAAARPAVLDAPAAQPLSMRQAIATVLANLINRGSFHGSWLPDRLPFGDGNAFAEKAIAAAVAAGWIVRGDYDPTELQCAIGIGGMPGRDVARCDEVHRSAVGYHWITKAIRVLGPAEVEAQIWSPAPTPVAPAAVATPAPVSKPSALMKRVMALTVKAAKANARGEAETVELMRARDELCGQLSESEAAAYHAWRDARWAASQAARAAKPAARAAVP